MNCKIIKRHTHTHARSHTLVSGRREHKHTHMRTYTHKYMNHPFLKGCESRRDRKKNQKKSKSVQKNSQRVSHSGGKKLRMGRIIIVGQGRVGKTALGKALVGKEFEPTDRSLECSWLRLLLFMCSLSPAVHNEYIYRFFVSL